MSSDVMSLRHLIDVQEELKIAQKQLADLYAKVDDVYLDEMRQLHFTLNRLGTCLDLASENKK